MAYVHVELWPSRWSDIRHLLTVGLVMVAVLAGTDCEEVHLVDDLVANDDPFIVRGRGGVGISVAAGGVEVKGELVAATIHLREEPAV